MIYDNILQIVGNTPVVELEPRRSSSVQAAVRQVCVTDVGGSAKDGVAVRWSRGWRSPAACRPARRSSNLRVATRVPGSP